LANPALLSSEAAADAQFGFPPGTLEALGMSETSQGTNLGTIGNIFQVTPSTAANPGFGLSGVNGNDPFSVGAFLNALVQGPGQGSLANGLALYQGRPIGSTGNTAMSSFLSSLGTMNSGGLSLSGVGAGVAAIGANVVANSPAGLMISGASALAGGSNPVTNTLNALNPTTWLAAIEQVIENSLGRTVLIIIGIILLIGAVFMFAKDQGVELPSVPNVVPVPV
jgi:hypothetical protein